METSEKPFPPEGDNFFTSLQAYHDEQLTRLRLEGDEQLRRFGTALLEQEAELGAKFAKYGISFHEHVALLFG